MSVQRLSLSGVALCAITLVSGCSMFGFGDDEGADARVSSECQRSRSSCMYEGRYEPNEKEYAEQEAKRLNKASAAKLRRGW